MLSSEQIRIRYRYLPTGEIMNAGYEYGELHDEVLDAVEQDIISVNLPRHQISRLPRQHDADCELSPDARLHA